LIGAASLGAMSVGLTGCDVLIGWHYRFRLTGWVECDGKIIHGSSVIEITRVRGYDAVGGSVHGEAVAIDIPGRTTLFLLLRDAGSQDWAIWMPHHAFASQLDAAATTDGKVLDRLSHSPGTTATLAPADYPMMVRFRDLDDPATIERVDPANLAASFGPGITFRGITVQLTKDPVTTGISRSLPWLSTTPAGLVRDNRANITDEPAFGVMISGEDFRRNR
jgi:hypothetical protein